MPSYVRISTNNHERDIGGGAYVRKKNIYDCFIFFHFCCCVMSHNDAGSYYKTTDTKRESMRGY